VNCSFQIFRKNSQHFVNLQYMVSKIEEVISEFTYLVVSKIIVLEFNKTVITEKFQRI
jgi:hypothetical protein